ncbi:ATP-grasp domain-containing protein [Streptomyces sp. MUM 203J]|uniref:ATP-grasp domain-containing protein n=1 Tax=Streptomyces sp. MUM 203J TaxID=2791990 RepID=UPI001F042E28|nr:ATP-grasp domain-containing protein [Streptomyces sp. MUM 203J]MCH0538531.1 ATP-grasp domain-containing protein [Streptomyces sp. MUM 203J]
MSVNTPERPRVILVGSRIRQYREYALASLAARYEVTLVAPEAPTWQARYVETHRIADTTDAAKLFPAVADLRGEVAEAAVLTWDEWSLTAVSAVAAKLRLRAMDPAAARICRDKYAARQAFEAAGMAAVRHAPATSEDEALAAAESIGFPVVVKPRTLGGSFGVMIARDADELRRAYQLAHGSRLQGAGTADTVLVEEFVEGPELSIDSVVVDGTATPVCVARKRLGPHPYFEEVGHLVTAWQHEPWADAVTELVRSAHRAVGVDYGVTHTEVRLSPDGPRLIELNGRLGGDLIPHLHQLATGVDLARAAAEIAFERTPDLTPTRSLSAEIRFLYPAHDGTVDRVVLPEPSEADGLAESFALAAPGDELQLPPRGLTPRYGALLAVGDTPADTRGTLDRAEGRSRVEVTGAEAHRLGARVENPVTRRFFDHERTARRMTVSGVRGVEWFRYGAGGGEGLNRPVFLSAEDVAGLERDLNGLFELLKAVPHRLFDGDLRAFARAVGMSGTQTELVLRGASPELAPLSRADLYRETGGFRVMELNTGSSLGGWQMGEFARALVGDEEFAAFAAEENLVHPDPLARITDVLRRQAPSLAGIERPLLAITDWPDGFENSRCWMEFVVPAFEALGFEPVVCHLGDFTYEDGRVLYQGRRVDVVYRMFLPGEMPDEPRTYELVNPLLDAVEAGGVELFAPLDCELYGNKGSLAMLSDERNRASLTEEERALVDRILPWTRFVRDEKVTMDGERIDLLPYAVANKDRLVLKPTLLYGGVGVTPGWTTGQKEWVERLQQAVDGPFVLQQRLLPTVERFLSDDGVTTEDMAVAYGTLMVDGRYAGTLARGVTDPAVGIVSMLRGAQIGCAFHVAEAADGEAEAR